MRPLVLITVALLVLAGCGGEDAESPPEAGEEPISFENADEADVEVIAEWSETLSTGDVEAAAGFFALPSIAENGPAVIRIESLEDAVLFNEALPCGAVLVAAITRGDFTTATFELTERPGPGECGDGVGGSAKTSFQIEDGKIVEWRRVGIGPEPAPGTEI